MDLQQYCDGNSFILKSSYENILNGLRSNNITSAGLLLSSDSSIARKLNKTVKEVSTFKTRYKHETNKRIKDTTYHPFSISCEDEETGSANIVEERVSFTVGDELMDKLLNGGIPTGYLIEVSGKSASGKTNLLLTLCITIQLPIEFGGLGPSIFSSEDNSITDVKTLYIPTESSLATSRLSDIIEHYSALLEMNGISRENKRFFPTLDNVITTANVMSNLEEQDHILKYQLPVMLSKDPSIKMLVLDSLTHHVRAQLSWFEQVEYVRSTCMYLKKLSKQYNITIIIANQVTDKPVRGLYYGENDILWKLNTEYQLAWMNGWDDIGILYRQLMRREGIIDEAGQSFDRLDYLDDIQTGNIASSQQDTYESASQFEDSNSTSIKNDIKNILKLEKKRLFDSSYKVKVSGIGTRPALGPSLLDFVDMRIVLSKEYAPILDENLIDEFSVELGIDLNTLNESQQTQEGNTSLEDHSVIPLETSTQKNNEQKSNVDQKQIVKALANNNYLKHYNFETFRVLRCLFGPLIPAGETRRVEFEIWKGGLRKYTRS